MQWSPQQAAALDAVSAWYKSREKPIFRVFGYAGSGKTTLARHFANGIGGSVAYCAFTGKAAMVMRKNGCHGASTIHSTIYAVETDEKTGLAKFSLKPKMELSSVKLLIVDECSMVDEGMGNDLLSFGIPVLVLGDPAQLPAVNGAGFFTEHEPDVMLTEIHRQAAESPIVRLATMIREGRTLSHGTYGNSRVIKPSEVEQAEVMKADQVLVGVNETRRRYNRRIRELLGRESRYPVFGDRLVCLKNDKAIGLFNGSLWEVVRVRKPVTGAIKTPVIRMEVNSLDFEQSTGARVKVLQACFDGNIDELPWRERRGFQEFDFGNVLTVHKAQGSQWDNVCLFDESGSFRDSRERWLYTGITRASESITIVRN